MTRSTLIATTLALALVFTGPLHAAEFCATTGAQLQSALASAAVNGEHDTIRIAAGNYTFFTSPNDGFVYDAMVPSGDDKDLNLIGGWSAFFSNPCGQLLREDPFLTVIDGAGNHRAMLIKVRPNTNVSVRLLTFFDGDATPTVAGGLLVSDANSDTHVGSVLIERNAFFANRGDSGSGLYAYGGTGILRVLNNLFIGNHAEFNHGAAYLSRSGGSGIFFISNTVDGNTTDNTGPNSNGGVYVNAPGARQIGNNNLWANDGADLFVQGISAGYSVFNNNFAERIGTAPSASSGNLSVDPEYEEGLLDFAPRRNSPLVDAGAPPGMFSFWFLTTLDLQGDDRTVTTVDIGAYENERIFRNGFESASPFGIDAAPSAAASR